MNGSAFAVFALAIGRCFVDREQLRLIDADDAYGQTQQRAGDQFEIASEAAQKVVIALVKSGSPQPAGDHRCTAHGRRA